MNEQKPPDESFDKPLNSFQLLARILSAAAGVRSTRERGRQLSTASTGAVLGAVLIFLTALLIGVYAFINAVKDAAAS